MPSVLVVDDDTGIRESLDMFLTDEGYEVASAENGLHALEVLRQLSQPTVLLFDYLMPHGTGLDLLQGVTADETLLRRTAAICMAARDRHRLPTELIALMDCLGVHFIAKPFDLDAVLTAVCTAQQRLAATAPTWHTSKHPHA